MKYAVATNRKEAIEAIAAGFGFDSFREAEDALQTFRWRYKNNSCVVIPVSEASASALFQTRTSVPSA